MSDYRHTVKPQKVTLAQACKSLAEECSEKNEFNLSDLDTWNPEANLTVTLTVAEAVVIMRSPRILRALKNWIEADKAGETLSNRKEQRAAEKLGTFAWRKLK
jgi:hypothetical protein